MDAEVFGSFIQIRRKELGLSQAALAEKLHVTAKAVSRWERGVGFPDIKLLEPLADALEITIVELMQSRRIEEDLPKETAAAIVTQTVISIQEQEELSWKRKLILFFGTVGILVAEVFLIWVSRTIVREPMWISFCIHLIGVEGGILGIRALRMIITRTYLQPEAQKYKVTWPMRIAMATSLVSVVLLILAARYMPYNTLLRDFVVFLLLVICLGCGLYYSVKMRDGQVE